MGGLLVSDCGPASPHKRPEKRARHQTARNGPRSGDNKTLVSTGTTAETRQNVPLRAAENVMRVHDVLRRPEMPLESESQVEVSKG